MKKGDILKEIVVEAIAAEGKCLSRLDGGRVLFIEGAAPGDTVDVQIMRIKSSFIEGKATYISTQSLFRSQPFCDHFGLCGGCTWQHVQYAKQIEHKQQQVHDTLERIGGLSVGTIKPIIPAPNTTHYRNKLDYTFTARRWFTKEEFTQEIQKKPEGLGYHLPTQFDKVFDVDQCHLQPDPSNALRLFVKKTALDNQIPFFDLRKQTGYLRTLTIRTTNIGETMVILQVAYDKPEWLQSMLHAISSAFSQVTSINYVINEKRNDTFHDLNIICWKGKPYITETMSKPDGSGVLQFRIGPKSFYQTNATQAYNLYKIVWQMAALQGHERVYDLYTGTGTIASFLAPYCRTVIGLEYVQTAIDDAHVNAAINGITNTQFFAGDIKNLLNDDFLKLHGHPDVVITDPPRAGMHEDVCAMLLKANPTKIIYVSCNPATQARDLKILSTNYKLTDIQPLDMFPHTTHVENVVSLIRK